MPLGCCGRDGLIQHTLLHPAVVPIAVLVRDVPRVYLGFLWRSPTSGTLKTACEVRSYLAETEALPLGSTEKKK